MLLTVEMYLMGRERSHASEFTPVLLGNAREWVRRNNLLLARMAQDGVAPATDQVTGTAMASGWRPPGVNARTANAGKASTHITCEGGDLQDHLDRRLARWCLAHLDVLEQLELWIEDPRWTAGRTGTDPWLHTQTRAPRSGRRVYVPNLDPPQCAPLPPWSHQEVRT